MQQLHCIIKLYIVSYIVALYQLYHKQKIIISKHVLKSAQLML